MKHLKETEVWQKEKLMRDHQLAVMMMIRQQIDMVGQLMERHKELVKAPLSTTCVLACLNNCRGIRSRHSMIVAPPHLIYPTATQPLISNSRMKLLVYERQLRHARKKVGGARQRTALLSLWTAGAQ